MTIYSPYKQPASLQNCVSSCMDHGTISFNKRSVISKIYSPKLSSCISIEFQKFMICRQNVTSSPTLGPRAPRLVPSEAPMPSKHKSGLKHLLLLKSQRGATSGSFYWTLRFTKCPLQLCASALVKICRALKNHLPHLWQTRFQVH